MAKYIVTRSCGHNETVNLIGKTKDRDWRLENVEPNKLCFECWESKKIADNLKANEEAKKQAIEQELPELTGSEKQIAWAETIRQSFLSKLNTMIEKRKPNHPLAIQGVDRLTNKSTAKWWIENARVDTDRELANLLLIEVQELEKLEVENIPAIIDAKAESTVRLETVKTETVAEITLVGDILKVDFPEKRNDFWELIKKELNFSWSNGCWERKLGTKQGELSDRIVEVGNKLLSAGFIIRIYDYELRQRAVNGEYKQECTRWITKQVDKDILFIGWGKDEDFYTSARKITSSKYDKPYIAVKPEHFAEVEDFAEMYKFEFSEKAKELIKQAKAIKELSITAKAIKVKKETVSELTKPPVLEVVENDIADEFKD